jgi:hypothetical protein
MTQTKADNAKSTRELLEIINEYDQHIRNLCATVQAFISHERYPEVFDIPHTDNAERYWREADEFNVSVHEQLKHTKSDIAKHTLPTEPSKGNKIPKKETRLAKNAKIIRYLGTNVIVACDRKCEKAWGVLLCPRKQLSEQDVDDFVYLSDSELGTAPRNPGTYEGRDGKPISPDEFPNKWCVRQCERCVMSKQLFSPIKLRDWNNRVYNKPQKHEA